MAGPAGIEPTPLGSKPSILSIELRTVIFVAEGKGIEPLIAESKSAVIPFN